MMKRKVFLGFAAAVFIVGFLLLLSQVSMPEDLVTKPDATVLLAPYESTEHKKMLEHLAEVFHQENKEIKITLEYAPQEDYIQQVLLRSIQNDLPDMLVVDSNYISYLANEKLLRDMTYEMKKINGQEGFVKIYPSLLMDSSIAGKKIYGAPFTCTTYALFCNDTLIESVQGSTPRTWDDLERSAQKLIGKGPEPFAFSALQTDELTYQFFALFFASGATLLEIDSEDALQAFSLAERMAQSGTLASECVNWSQRDLTVQFAKGELAMMINAGSQLPVLRGKGELGFEWSVSPLPVFSEEPDVTRNSFSQESIAIMNQEKFNNCMAFIRFIYQGDTLRSVAHEYGGIPLEADTTPEGRTEQIFFRQIDNSASIGPYRLWGDISKSFQDNLFRLLTQEQHAEQTAEKIQKEVRDFRVSG